MKKYLLIPLIALSSCGVLPKQEQLPDSRVEIIPVGFGPEDMAVDSITEEPRLLLSCNARRKNQGEYGEIFVYYTESGKTKTLKRIGEPKDLVFNPHGIDLVKTGSELILLAVNHEQHQTINSILRYKVLKDEMIFIEKIIDPLISSPNAVAGFPDGTFLVSNDAKKANHFVEALFMLKQAQVVFYDGKKCSVAAEKFCYTNGITIKDKKVFLASTRQNKVWQFDFESGKMRNKEVIAKIPGADNLRLDGDNLLAVGHLRFLKFLKHVNDSTKLSPTTAYYINPKSKTQSVVYYDYGKQLSAGSTAILFRNNLYVVGIFDAKMAVVKQFHFEF